MIRTLVAAAALISVTGAAQAEPAAKALETRVRIDYRDLDVSREADARILLRRISISAAVACGGPAPQKTSAAQNRAYLECRQRVADQLVAATRQPLVLALHRGQASPIAVARR
jgi:UrcA family protein